MASSARLHAINNMGIEGAFLYDGIPAVLVETPEKTASVAFMADAWPGRVDADQYRIGVAVHAHFAHLQRVAAQFPFAPEFAPRTAEKSHRATRARRLIRFLVHETEHQHLARPRVLDDGGNEPAELGKIEIHPSSLGGAPTAAPSPHTKNPKKNPLGVCRASGSMRAFRLRLLKPPRARLATVMMMVVMMMMPAQIHDQETVTKTGSGVKAVPRAIEIRRVSYFFRLFLFVLFQLQRGRIDAKPQARGLRAVRKDVPQMRLATAAHHFRAHHPVGFICFERHLRFVHGRVEAWPAGAGIKLRIRIEQRLAAADAVEHAMFLGVPVFAREGRLGALLASHLILFVGKLFTPFRVCLLHFFRLFFDLFFHVADPHSPSPYFIAFCSGPKWPPQVKRYAGCSCAGLSAPSASAD